MILTTQALQVQPFGTPELSDSTVQVPNILLPIAQFSEQLTTINAGQNPTMQSTGGVFQSSAVSGVTAFANIALCRLGLGMWEINLHYTIGMSFAIPDGTINNLTNEDNVFLEGASVLGCDLLVMPGIASAHRTFKVNLGLNRAAVDGAWQVSFQRPACIVAEFVTVQCSIIANKLA